MKLLLGLLLWEAEEGEFGRCAKFAIALYCSLHEGKVALHLTDVSTYLQLRAFRVAAGGGAHAARHLRLLLHSARFGYSQPMGEHPLRGHQLQCLVPHLSA